MYEVNWRKSSFSEGQGANCVEIAASGPCIRLRESDDPEIILSMTRETLGALISGIRRGRFDTLVP